MALKRDNSTNIHISEKAWSEIVAALHPKDRSITYVEGEPAFIVRVGLGSRVVRVVRRLKGKEKGKMTAETNIDFEDQKLATVHGGFDSAEDEASWVAYLDEQAATMEAEQLERLAADSAYEERKLERILNNDNF